MIVLAIGLLSMLQSDTLARPVRADTYADSATARFVSRVRAARDRNERLVTAYTATASQRIGVGIRALSRDRMLYRQELVVRIAWKRDSPSTVEVIGAREGIPIVLRGDHVPADLADQAESLVLNPAEDYLRLIGGDSNDGFVYPLRAGSEEDYQFSLGDTTTITLPNGRQVRLVALHVTPRRTDWRLIAGTLWFDVDTDGLVRAVFRPARPFEFRRDTDPEDREDVPGFVNPRAEVKYITLEYALYESRWWMPRYMAIDANGTMGSWLGVPVRIERVYEDYAVEGGTPPPPGQTFRPAGTVRTQQDRREERERLRAQAASRDSAEARQHADSVRARIQGCIDDVTARRDQGTARGRSAFRREIRACSRRDRDTTLVVVIPDDTLALLTSPELGPPILNMGDLITEEELLALRGEIGRLPSPGWGPPRIDLPAGASAILQHARFNRVEGLSLGASGAADFGYLRFEAVGRIGFADLVPNGEVALTRTMTNGRVEIGAYRRLSAANPDTRPFGPINSTLALMAQRDDGEYYRALGLELAAQNTNAGWWNARVFVQRERPAAVETNASLPRFLGGDSHVFRPNIIADSADLTGGSLTLRGARALSPTITVSGDVTLDGATGDFDFGRGAATARLYVTPGGPVAGAVSVSAGTSAGTIPAQHLFYLGGPGTLRGYSGGVTSGAAFWAARAEVGNSFPGARVSLFTDIGWAGDRSSFWQGRPLIGAGAGVSLLDGLFRIDLGRGLRTPKGWRLEFSVDGLI